MAKAPNISFIPKKPLAHDLGGGHRPLSMLLGVAVGLLVIVWGVFGGMYVYKGILQDDINQKKIDLKDLNNQYDKKVVADAQTIRNELVAGKQLLDAHTVTLPLFSALASILPRGVYFTDFNLTKGDAGTNTTMQADSADFILSAKGVAGGFAQAANLRDALAKKTDVLKSSSLSGIGLDSTGQVTFTLDAVVDSSFVNYIDQSNKMTANMGTFTGYTNGFGVNSASTTQ